MITINLNPSQRELHWFGLIASLFLGLVGGILYDLLEAATAAYAVWCVAGVLTVAYYLIPTLRLPMYRGWIYAVYPVGWTISHLLLGIVFYLLITPIGCAMQVCGRDPMQRRSNANAGSYWVKRRISDDQRRYFRQF